LPVTVLVPVGFTLRTDSIDFRHLNGL
jgi:hypothetical protein